MNLAVITLHYKNLNDTTGLLRSLADTVKPRNTKIAVYVVDNEGSKALDHVIEQDFPKVNLIKNRSNSGFTGGNNLGLKQAIADGADLLICINNDTYVEKSFFEKILQSPIQDPQVGVVGGLIYFAPGFEFKKGYQKADLGKVVWYAGGKFDRDNVLGSNDHVDEIDRGQFKNVVPTDFVTGALLITKPAIVSRAGLFDDNYFMYLEDADLSERIRRAGFRVIFDPHIRIWHKVAQSSGIGSSLNDYFITRNRLLFGRKYLSFRTQFALLREAGRKLIVGSRAQKAAVLDFFSGHLGRGTWYK